MAALPELLAPAGSHAVAEAAFDHGADAVYVGMGQQNLRAHAASFDPEGLSALLALAASRKKRVYVTLNSMPDDDGMLEIEAALTAIAAMKYRPDALIVSDPGVLDRCRKRLPELPLHLSTQTGVFNSAAARFWKKQGVSRIVLPRELTIDQIRSLARDGDVPVEVFIHGAMCVSVSGRCLLGAYLDGRHPNKGDCTQPCRLRYRIDPIDASGRPADRWFEAEETADGVYLLNAKDLCGLAVLPAIIDAGVSAIKIEGRNKGMHYVATVVRVYRAALDAWAADPASFTVREEWVRELDLVEHRPYTTGFYGGERLLQAVEIHRAAVNSRMAGVVKGALADGAPVIDVRTVFRPGDRLQVLPLNRRVPPYEISFSSLTDLAGSPLAYTPLHRLAVGRGVSPLQPGDLLRLCG